MRFAAHAIRLRQLRPAPARRAAARRCCSRSRSLLAPAAQRRRRHARRRPPAQPPRAAGARAPAAHEAEHAEARARAAGCCRPSPSSSNFVILVGVLVYFLRAPIAAYLAARSTQIRQDLRRPPRRCARRPRAQLAEIEQKLKALPAELEALRARGAEDVVAERGAHRPGRGGRARAAARADAPRDRHAAAARPARAASSTPRTRRRRRRRAHQAARSRRTISCGSSIATRRS